MRACCMAGNVQRREPRPTTSSSASRSACKRAAAAPEQRASSSTSCCCPPNRSMPPSSPCVISTPVAPALQCPRCWPPVATQARRASPRPPLALGALRRTHSVADSLLQ